MIILGIDPGSIITGFGILKVNIKYDCLYVTSGCIKITKKDIGKRLQEIQEGINEIITTYQPTNSAIEKIFMVRNASSALKLGQARGVAMCTLANNNLPINEYSAKQVKKAIVGNGNASKALVQNMVQTFLKLSNKPQTDAADALAIAICHFHSYSSLLYIPAKKIVRGRLR